MFKNNNRLYKKLPKNVIKTNFSGLDFPFDPSWKRIGINLSGGADSALLTYLLCKIIKDNNFKTRVDIITYQRCWETRPWQGYYAQQVYDKLFTMFPDIIENRHLCYIPPELEHGSIGNIVNNRSGDMIIVGSYNKFSAWHHNLDAVFNGTSMNPDDSRTDRMKSRDKSAVQGSLNDLWHYVKSVDTFFVHPFKFVKKDWIVAQYHLMDILDLYNTTRSCEGDIRHHEAVKNVCSSFKDYEYGMHIPECNQCWWCEERRWANSRVNDMIKEINEL